MECNRGDLLAYRKNDINAIKYLPSIVKGFFSSPLTVFRHMHIYKKSTRMKKKTFTV